MLFTNSATISYVREYPFLAIVQNQKADLSNSLPQTIPITLKWSTIPNVPNTDACIHAPRLTCVRSGRGSLSLSLYLSCQGSFYNRYRRIGCMDAVRFIRLTPCNETETIYWYRIACLSCRRWIVTTVTTVDSLNELHHDEFCYNICAHSMKRKKYRMEYALIHCTVNGFFYIRFIEVLIASHIRLIFGTVKRRIESIEGMKNQEQRAKKDCLAIKNCACFHQYCRHDKLASFCPNYAS